MLLGVVVTAPLTGTRSHVFCQVDLCGGDCGGLDGRPVDSAPGLDDRGDGAGRGREAVRLASVPDVRDQRGAFRRVHAVEQVAHGSGEIPTDRALAP